MAKSRAQRKAEQRRRAQQQRGDAASAAESQAQHDTQVPESADVIEAEIAEHGVDLDELRGKPEETPPEARARAVPAAPAPSRADVGAPAEAETPAEAPADKLSRRAQKKAEAPAEAPADKLSRRAQKRAERERRAAAKESERRRAPKEEVVEKQRGALTGFLASCWAELKRVQWPDRETLIQASAITVVFIAVLAAYLGVLDLVFNWLVQRIL